MQPLATAKCGKWRVTRRGGTSADPRRGYKIRRKSSVADVIITAANTSR